MKTVVKYQTFDGEVHDTRERAIKHLDNVYSAAIGKVINALMKHIYPRSYLQLGEHVDTHLSDFIYLQKIKDDYALINDDDD
jgi:hypothetical protein